MSHEQRSSRTMPADIDERNDEAQGSSTTEELPSKTPESKIIANALRAAQNALYAKAVEYRGSHPGDPSMAKNHTTHIMCRHVLENYRTFDEDLILSIERKLNYRLFKVMHRATAYKNYLGLDCSDCNEIDAYRYGMKFIETPDERQSKELYYSLIDMVYAAHIFPSPEEGEGWQYGKGYFYLAAAMVENRWDKLKALDELGALGDIKHDFYIY